MSDEELCRALRLLAFHYNDGAPSQAADRIEQLAATNEKLKARLDLSEGALGIASRSWGECQQVIQQTQDNLARATQSLERLVYLQSGNPCTRIQAKLWVEQAIHCLTNLRSISN